MKASGDPASVDLSEALSQLRAQRDAIPWPERRQIVARIAGPLAEGQAGDPFRALLLLLAEDPKWEVRKDVADALATIPGQRSGDAGRPLPSRTATPMCGARRQAEYRAA